MITPENATKYASIFFLLLIGVSTVFVGIWDIIHNIPLPDYVKLVIGTGITYSITALSLNHGASVALKGVQSGTNSQPL